MTGVRDKNADVIKIAAVQMEPVIGKKEENLEKMNSLIDVAADQGSKLIIFPELANTGYAFKSLAELREAAEEIPRGISCETWARKAEERDVYIVAGMAEREGNKVFNSGVVIGPDKYVGVYRKNHLWYKEKLIFEEGNDGFPVFDLPFGKLGIQICYDFWFVEGVRILALQGADIIAVPTNWPAGEPETTWDQRGYCMGNYRAMAHSNFNKVFIACANRVGVERGGRFAGCSIITDSNGKVLSGPASKDKEEILYGDFNVLDVRRNKLLNLDESLAGRRCDLYGELLGYEHNR